MNVQPVFDLKLGLLNVRSRISKAIIAYEMLTDQEFYAPCFTGTWTKPNECIKGR